jgi:hypothetical protein
MTLSGSTITNWKDKSGNGVTFTVGGTPTLSNAAYNSLSSVYFNGSANFYNTTFSLNLVNHSFFIVTYQPTGGNVGVLVFHITGTGTDDVYSPNALQFASPEFGVQGSYGAQPYSNLTYGIYGDVATPTNNSLILYKNGTSVITKTGLTTASSTGIAVGSRVYSGGYTYFMTGYVSEVIVYNTALTDIQRKSIEGYLGWKWGIQANLPVGHPYLTYSPKSGVGAGTSPLTIRLNNQVNANANQTFIGTSAVQTFTVPNGVFWIRFFLWGAGGTCQDGSKISRPDAAGSGSYVEGNLRTAPGTVYYIIVGRAGLTGLNNGGGGSGFVGTNGGGFTGIFSGSPAFGNAIAIAGGGGGSGTNNGNYFGGGGGYPSGGNGTGGATGGTQSAGGSGSSSGSQLQGANGGGGGGGGGYYGGGAGTGGNPSTGGGGGSSYYMASIINPITVNGINTATVGTNTLAANETSPYWVSPYGRSGYDGYAVIGFNTNTNAAPLRITLANFPITSGGVITTSGPYKVHTFKTVGTSTFITNKQVTAEVLVVGGGGGGGNNVGGGGGAGAALYSSLFSIPAGSYTITIGGGGAPDTNGSSSIFSSLTAVGGGRGGSWRGGSGASGGCGGGGAGDSGVGAAGTVGFAGGSSTGNISSGGGGGMGGPGFNAVVGKTEGGAGGLGATYSVGGASYLVCGGGAGSSYRTAPAVVAAGGSGIGGSGANSEFGPGPTNPTPNTGSGGGGGGGGTSGAAGIIVIALIPSLS